MNIFIKSTNFGKNLLSAYNVSVVDQMIFMIRFSKSQKRYRYRYLDEWGEWRKIKYVGENK
jgi:predicted alternative tryptophan synthase beta-subunit